MNIRKKFGHIVCIACILVIVLFPQTSNAFTYQGKFGTQGSGNTNFFYPRGAAVDSASNLYVADTDNHRILKFSPTGTYISQFGTQGTGNGQFDAPNSLAIDSSGNIYVVDFNNSRVQKFNSSGVYVSQFGTNGSGNGQFIEPVNITIDASSSIYVVDQQNHRVQKFNSSGVYVSQFGTAGGGNGQFDSPSGVAVDTDGNIYVVEVNGARVQKFNAAGTYVSQFGSAGSGNGQFTSPQNISLDPTKTFLYVNDSGNHRVQKFTLNGTYVSQFGTSGTGDGEYNTPLGFAMSTAGYTYVVDTLNSRVQYYLEMPTPGVPSVTPASATTTDTTPTFTVSCQLNYTVELRASTTTYGSATCNTNVATITSSVLPLGTYNFFAVQGNGIATSSASASSTLIIEAAPVVPDPEPELIVSQPVVNRISFGGSDGVSSSWTSAPVVTPIVASSTPELCVPYIIPTVTIALGMKNDAAQVMKLQTYLGLTADGIFKEVDAKAVKVFQEKYKTEILAPWGFKTGTGIASKTTIAKINALKCGESLGCPVFTQKTKLMDTHSDVPRIKNFLNQTIGGTLNTSSSIADPATIIAIKKFQTQYKDFVLKPLGITHATGLWYEASMRQANTFMGCGQL